MKEFEELSEEEIEATSPGSRPALPTRSRILGEAQAIAYIEAGEPDVEIDTAIDYEVVIIQRRI